MRPHYKGNIGHAKITCIYNESLDNYIKLYEYDDNKRYLWIEINMGKENIYIDACDIYHKESNYSSRFELERDDLSTTYVKISCF